MTLPKGVVVTVTGAGIRNGKIDHGLCLCELDSGGETLVLARVIADLPVTYRRAELSESFGR